MKVRIPLSPRTTNVQAFKVFVSYRATHAEIAHRIRVGLEGQGFQVLMIEPSQYELYRTNMELLVALRQKVRTSDAICILASETLEQSEYVQAEINEALRGLGRAVFVHDGTAQIPSHFKFHDPGPEQHKVSLVIKHTLVGISAWDEGAYQELAIQLLNDPDEGWFDDLAYIENWWFERDLHTECVLRRYARECLHVDPRIEGQTIRDVIPLMRSWHYPENPDEMFEWYATTFGRRELLESIASGDCDGMVTNYFTTREDLVQFTVDGWLAVLYLRNSAGRVRA